MSNRGILPVGAYRIRTLDELPKHITHSQYMLLREKPKEHYDRVVLMNKQNDYLAERDRLFIDFLWETGGRVGDVTRIRKEHIDFREKILTLNIKKSKDGKKTIRITLSNEMCYDIMNFYTLYRDKEPFDMSTANARKIMKKYGPMIGVPDLHPHMFRHGLALYMLSQQAPIPIISYRLGHSNTKVTMDFYLRVTPEIEGQYIKEIEFR